MLELKPILIVAHNTSMQTGEIRQLQWLHINREKGFIRLPAELRKEKRPKTISLNHRVRDALDSPFAKIATMTTSSPSWGGRPRTGED